MTPLMILMLVLNVLFVLIAAQLTRIARSKHLPNLYWLALNYFAGALGGFSMEFIPNPLPSTLGFIISSFFTVLFIQHTFYRDRKSPYLFFIVLLIICGVIQVWSTFSPIPGFSLMYLGYTFVWGWQVLLAFRNYRLIENDKTVEDWVKARYLLWMSYTLIMTVLAIRNLIPLPAADVEIVISTTLVIVSGILQYVTWVMPEALRQYLNRNYRPVAAENVKAYIEMSEDELVRHIRLESK